MVKIDPASMHPKVMEAIFGGPIPSDLASLLKPAGLNFPCRIAVARGVVTRGPARIQSLQLHPGMTYLMLPIQPVRWTNPPPVMGESFACAAAEEWLKRLRQAILSLREAELKDASLKPTRENEEQARLMAMAQIRRSSNDWQTAVRVWIGMLMRLNYDHLNLVRRRMVEFITLLTAPFPDSEPIAYPFQRGIQRIFATYDYADLQAVFTETISDLLPFVTQLEPTHTPCDALVHRAMELIRKRYAEPISLRDIAAQLNVSSAHLARSFKLRSKHTVGQWLDTMRVGHAKRRLMDSRDTIYAIAMDSGFNSVERFHHVFKRHAGTTPHRYRQESHELTSAKS